MSSKPVAFILGAGPRAGAATAKKFASIGYDIAVSSRKGLNATDDSGYLSLQADFANPNSIPDLFDKVQQHFGVAPSVVVYNAAALTPPPIQENALSIPTASMISDTNINTISPYVAAQEAVKGFETLNPDVKKVFIYTGNCLNVEVPPVPLFLSLGVGKAASAYWVGTADMFFQSKGYRFFYADQRFPDGKNVGLELDGEAHADFYASLLNDGEKVPWHATFVKGEGYAKFEGQARPKAT